MDKKLKQRLLGAAVVTALAVLIVPEIVKNVDDQEVKTAKETTATLTETATDASEQKLTISTPTVTEQGTSTTPLPLPDEPSIAATDAPPPDANVTNETLEDSFDEPEPEDSETAGVALNPVPEPSPPQPQQIVEDNTPPPVKKTTRETTPPQTTAAATINLPAIELIAKPNAEAAATPNAWVVQVGSFALEENANLLRDRLRAKKFTAGIESITVDGEIRYRVRVGPQTSRADSEAVRDRLQREENLSGNIVPLNS